MAAGSAALEVGDRLLASLMVRGFFIRAEKALEDSSDSGTTSASKLEKVGGLNKCAIIGSHKQDELA